MFKCQIIFLSPNKKMCGCAYVRKRSTNPTHFNLFWLEMMPQMPHHPPFSTNNPAFGPVMWPFSCTCAVVSPWLSQQAHEVREGGHFSRFPIGLYRKSSWKIAPIRPHFHRFRSFQTRFVSFQTTLISPIS